MRVLAVRLRDRVPDNSAMYKALAQLVDLDILWLDKKQQKKLNRYAGQALNTNYDCCLIDLHFKYVSKQARFLKRIKHVFLLEEDACQNYILTSRWYGKFSKFYQKLKHVYVLCSGVEVTRRLCKEGHNAVFFPKGFDPDQLYIRDSVESPSGRDISLGFIGRTKSQAYQQRQQFLEKAQEELEIECLRTVPGEDYAIALNRIQFFLSVDMGLLEYMTKNIEAMACGCVVLAYEQGTEESVLGFKDMENIVLYQDIESLKEKLNFLKKDPGLSKKIAMSGQALVLERYAYPVLAQHLSEIIKKSLQTEKTLEISSSWWQRCKPWF